MVNNVYHATFRSLDPSIGRWWQTDPAAESFYGVSPYNSMGNNPISNIDPNGDEIIGALIGAVLGGVVNGIIHRNREGGFWQGFAIGAVAGFVGGLTFNPELASLAATAASGAVSAGIGDVLLQTGNNFAYNDPISEKQLLISMAVGGVFAAGGYLLKGAKATSTIKNPEPVKNLDVINDLGAVDNVYNGSDFLNVGNFDVVGSVSGVNVGDDAVSLAVEVVAERSKYAFGLKNVVPEFAREIGAMHLMNDPNWKSTFMKVINNPNSKIYFNLNGIDSTPMQMILNPGRSGINWELNALYQNTSSFDRTIFLYGGKTLRGIDIFKITP